MRFVTPAILAALSMGLVNSFPAQSPQSKPGPGPARLYSDAEIRKLAKHDIDKETGGDKGLLGIPCLDVVPNGESYTRAKVFKALNLDDARLRDFRDFGKGNVVFLTWQVSPSYDICCMSATNDRENDGLTLTDPKRKVYGIRLLKRAK
jgi:hypothetical protein